MRDENVVTVYRTDYQPPAFLVDRIDLEFDLDSRRTIVTATLSVRRNPAAAAATAGAAPLLLDGEELELLDLQINGRAPASGTLVQSAEGLTIAATDDRFTVRLKNAISPETNSELMGLFVSRGNLFTQCEAEGFRRITFFPDRPDVMSAYTALLRADPKRFPVLLANGNLAAQGQLPDGRHFARWEDPFPKPCYLFALVAGDFVCREEKIRTRSGREAVLQVWVEPGQIDKTAHAMLSLQRAIAWDEERFGLELDLDRFMIVASHDFNIGAMENKGLNIFNAKYVLAHPSIATDTDYANIESIVGHEYFHNWTGNRVTCRDWFQLSLKEGLTVFRDQEFSADMIAREAARPAADALHHTARAVKRIDDVRTLRATQFPEDAGPMAHPVRPDSYQEIGNFYTATVYEKGAEVIRMLHTLLGRANFRRGLERYFAKHDGQAVTCDDFVTALAEVNPRRLGGERLDQFRRWYAQAGTPRISAVGRYDASKQQYELTLIQSCPPTPGQPEKETFLIPLAAGLLDRRDGRDMPLHLAGEAPGTKGETTLLLELTEAVQTFRFVDVPIEPVPSLLRNFSAPVIVDYHYNDDDLALLATFDSDAFNRWEAGQRLALSRLAGLADALETEQLPRMDEVLTKVFRQVLADPALAPNFKEQALQLPSEAFIADQRAIVDPDAIRNARRFARKEIGLRLSAEFDETYAANATPGPYAPDSAAVGKRALKNLALSYLVESGAPTALELARKQLADAANMTDRLAALRCIVNSPAPFKAEILLQTAREWHHEPLLMNKWFQLQSTAASHPGEPPVLARVRMLTKHAAYSSGNPNNVYALVLGFCANNPAEFHRSDGAGYAFWREQVLRLDKTNPTVAARVARTLDRWRKFTPDRQRLMQEALTEVARTPRLSRDVREIVTKALEN